MIKHHPNDSLLSQFVEGNLPASISVAIAAHVEMCPCCQKKTQQLEAQEANIQLGGGSDSSLSSDFEAMMQAITLDDEIDEVKEYIQPSFNYQGRDVQLPRAIANIDRTKFSGVGKIARSRLLLEDGDLRSSLLQIGAEGEIPEHTHTGFEITLLLDGDFADEAGEYVPGDFIWQDGKHSHSPRTKEGCLCFTVVSSALHFNKGLSKLLNPIGKLIY
ncbi:ChrR family anti-sigma-E factor [Pseudoalteromonas sp. JC3]|uniref:ChrR family anti-sigma-E factor n=1 Tax=Pseudoalteromonas sp. JC3 TaxID=2810196 RepID=UPI0019D27CCB|nr:ChrR family anti-sigma-E factor [Pseudoalteromonas sp. JC3]MBR8843601.1 ChrR family anti-sigma-E factor [Pseudoalteromonas sp. JC3]WJE11539.1 ChrR family anti-sigma-E factor [Pseudoalteromonas sp. JC3]